MSAPATGAVHTDIAGGDALAAKKEYAGALSAYRRAVAADERTALDRIARLCAEVRHPTEALKAAQRLLELEPGNVFAAACAADMLEALGRIDEAYAIAAPRVRSGGRDAYLVTVYGRICQRFEPPRDEALPLLERMAADEALEPRQRVKAMWILVHTLDELGRYDEAFERALALKALEARAKIARPPQARQRLDAAIAAYTPQRLARLPRASHGSRVPIFVLGMLRSGTTLTEQILASHPAVFGAGELADIATIALRTLTARAPYPQCLDTLTQADLNALAAPYLAKLQRAAPKARHVVDKMPTNFEHLGLIQLLFPQARVIHCVRQPLDSCLSLFFLPDASNTDSLEAVGRTYLRYQRIMRHWQGLLTLPMLTLKYEELIAEPERKVRELLEFCGLEWHDACLDFHRSGRYSRNFSYHQVRRPLYTRSVGRHRHYEKHLGVLKTTLARVPASQTWFERARALAANGEREQAIEAYRKSIEADPGLPQVHNNLGNLLTQMGRTEEALASLRRAIEIKPDYALAHYNLGNALKRVGNLEQAIALYHRAIELQPGYPEALNNLGNALKESDRLEESAAMLARAVAARPGFGEALHNYANVLRDVGRVEESLVVFDKALQALPEYAGAHFGYSLTLLLAGRYLEGWKEYEWRWRWEEFPGRKQPLPAPLWQGERFDGKTLHLYFEQGLGDTVQYLRYVPMVAERGGLVTLEVQRPLLRLCAPYSRWARVMAGGERREPYDLQCPLQTLSLVFGTTLETIPPGKYLAADPALARKWAARLEAAGPGLKVGLVWAGNPKQPSEPKRGIGLPACLPLLKLPGISWVSLMVGTRAADALIAPPGSVLDLSTELKDFAETAAVIANLDLVVTTDTAVAHVAGALGKPTWVMLRYVPDWRWHLGRDDCPWYPDMRLFRQHRLDDWTAVVADLKAALAERVAERGPAR